VLPCGRSAHLEAGWTAGNGTPLILYATEPQEPELMYRMADALCATQDELLDAVRKLDAQRRRAHRIVTSELTDEERRCLLLAEADGLTTSEISEVVGLPVATVERRLRGARALVAQGVAEGEQQPPHWRCWQDCGGCVRKVPDKGLTP